MSDQESVVMIGKMFDTEGGHTAEVWHDGKCLFKSHHAGYYEDIREEADKAVQNWANNINKKRIANGKFPVSVWAEWQDETTADQILQREG